MDITTKALEDFVNRITKDDTLANWQKIIVCSTVHEAYQHRVHLTNEELMEITQRAIDILERDGWIQGQLFDGNKACMMGAAQKAVTGMQRPHFITALDSFKVDAWAREMSAHFGWSTVPDFNDDSSTSFEDVIEKLREFLYEVKGR